MNEHPVALPSIFSYLDRRHLSSLFLDIFAIHF